MKTESQSDSPQPSLSPTGPTGGEGARQDAVGKRRALDQLEDEGAHFG